MRYRILGIQIAALLAFSAMNFEITTMQAQEKSVRPGINDSFKDPNVKEFVERFEIESREVFSKREEILKACGIKEGQTLADIGAGTGLFTRMFSKAVGSDGRVIAVDISENFLNHIQKTSRELNLRNIDTVLCKPDSTELEPESVDVAFICDTYHHFEFPNKTMTSLLGALRPGGRLVLIDFKRIEGESTDWTMSHVRAGQQVFEGEVLDVGFRKVAEYRNILKENYFVVFQKPSPDDSEVVAPGGSVIAGQPSFLAQSPEVELAITELGGHMAPVTFYRNSDSPIQPYHISPWQEESGPQMPAPVLVPLRGDFFCMPFGGNSQSVSGESHPPHGEVASSKWKLLANERKEDIHRLTLELETTIRKGKVTKEISLIDGQNVVYTKHTIEGFAGRVPLGHHATLALPERLDGVKLSASPYRFGMTYPGTFSDPTQREYQALQPGQRWKSISQVPMAWKGVEDADLANQPTRQGFADLVQVFNDPAQAPVGWMTATFVDQGYVWFSLKDPAILNSTVFWMENRGRHGYPWNGRNRCLGLEDVTAYFADGLKASSEENLLEREGIRTALELHADKPTVVPYIQGVVKVSSAFDIVKTIEFQPGKITLVSASGEKVTVPVRHEFLASHKL